MAEAESPNRATIAGLDAKVDGLTQLVRAETGAIQRQLDAVADLPARMAKVEGKVEALDERERASDADMDRRVSNLEGGARGDRNWRRSQLPIIVLTIFLVLVGIAQIIASFKP